MVPIMNDMSASQDEGVKHRAELETAITLRDGLFLADDA